MDFFYTDWLVGGKLWLFFCSVNSHSKAGGTNKQKRVALSLASVSIYFLSCLLKGCKQKLRKCQGGFLFFFFKSFLSFFKKQNLARKSAICIQWDLDRRCTLSRPHCKNVNTDIRIHSKSVLADHSLENVVIPNWIIIVDDVLYSGPWKNFRKKKKELVIQTTWLPPSTAILGRASAAWQRCCQLGWVIRAVLPRS